MTLPQNQAEYRALERRSLLRLKARVEADLAIYQQAGEPCGRLLRQIRQCGAQLALLEREERAAA